MTQRNETALPLRLTDATWETEKGVNCVVCPGCAFTFDADHVDDDGDGGNYTCPVCETRGRVSFF